MLSVPPMSLSRRQKQLKRQHVTPQYLGLGHDLNGQVSHEKLRLSSCWNSIQPLTLAKIEMAGT